MKTLLIIIFSFFNYFSFSQSILTDLQNDNHRKIITSAWEGNLPSQEYQIDTDEDLFVQLSCISIPNFKNEYFLTFHLFDTFNLGCLQENISKTKILFTDNSVIELMQCSSQSCNPNQYSATYCMFSQKEIANPVSKNDISIQNINKLHNNPIENITIYGTEGYHDYKIRQKKDSILIKHFLMISEQLIKKH
ncbi:MAG: hypothetical protein ACERKD_03030 [Prolixibacteraceae bacterium]